MVTTFDTPILDVEYIRARRLELGITRRQLAAECRTTDRALHCLERGDNHAQFLLYRVALMADALGVTIPDLLLQPSKKPAASNDARIEAALLHTRRQPRARDVRWALGLTEAEWEESVDHLRQRLLGTGATLITRDRGHCSIGAREGTLTAAEITAVRRPERARTELTLHQARILKRILTGENVPRDLTASASTSELMALGYLERNEFIRLDQDHYRLSGDVAYSLGLTNMPPRIKRRKP